jgi:hypothetical protein
VVRDKEGMEVQWGWLTRVVTLQGTHNNT